MLSYQKLKNNDGQPAAAPEATHNAEPAQSSSDSAANTSSAAQPMDVDSNANSQFLIFFIEQRSRGELNSERARTDVRFQPAWQFRQIETSYAWLCERCECSLVRNGMNS